ncbi:MAG: GrpB-like predicted nucleotidyltransferase (UPF0157 family) [Bacteriovoracaceae bacterium]|jgi:GrpB-like predicted nucleotidyltransferase (UPF0157 family)
MTKQTKIELVPYSPAWKKYFEKEKAGLKKLLRSNLLEVHHIGSTAISSIAAKPTLDILVEVHTLDGIEAFQDEFKRSGLIWQDDFDISERLYFIRLAPDGVTHLSHIHIFDKNSTHVKNHLDFRDYLNAELEVAKEYEKLKLTLNEQFDESSGMYMAGKNEFIGTVLKNIT